MELDRRERNRVIQEYVPGKQVTLAHIIANPDPSLLSKLGLQEAGAIGILTLTPTETTMIAADIATKAAAVKIGFLDRFTGTLVVTGSVAEVDAALAAINRYLGETLGFTVAAVTRT